MKESFPLKSSFGSYVKNQETDEINPFSGWSIIEKESSSFSISSPSGKTETIPSSRTSELISFTIGTSFTEVIDIPKLWESVAFSESLTSTFTTESPK